MSEKAFQGVSVSTKGGYSKLRGQPLQRHASAWWRCVQMAHGEDLDQLNGGSESSVHFVWGRRTQQDRLEQGPANNAIPMQPSYILFTQAMPWAFKLCLAKVTGPSLLYMTVGLRVHG